MGQTPELSIPYPDLGDSPNIPRDMQTMADRLEVVLKDNGAGQPVIVMDPQQSDWGWQNFPLGSTDSAGGWGYSGENKNHAGWICLNPAARWRFTAPTDGVLTVTGHVWFGYQYAPTNSQAYHVDLFQDVSVLSGSAYSVHSTYWRWRHVSDSIVDDVANLHSHHILKKGAEVSPFIMWRGKVYRHTNGAYHPRWNSGRMSAVFTPGDVAALRNPSHNTSKIDDRAGLPSDIGGAPLSVDLDSFPPLDDD